MGTFEHPARTARRQRGRRFSIAAAAAALSLGGALEPAGAVAPGDIVLGDITVMRLRTPSGGVSAEQRASMVQERVNEVLAIPNLKAKDVRVVPNPYGPTIYVRKIKLITVDPATAKAAGMTPDALAKNWAHRLMGIIDQVDIRVPGGGPAPAASPSPAASPAPGASPTASPSPAASPVPDAAGAGAAAPAATPSPSPDTPPAAPSATPAPAPATSPPPAAPATPDETSAPAGAS